MVGAWDEHEEAEDEHRPCSVRVLGVDVSGEQKAANDDENGADDKENECQADGFVRNFSRRSLKLFIGKIAVRFPCQPVIFARRAC